MTKIILHGCNGRMGQMISEICEEDGEVSIAAGIDVNDLGIRNYPVYTDLRACDVQADVLIDFSNAAAADAVLDYCMARKLPLVLCSTGLSEKQLENVKSASSTIAVLKSANMSLGINMLFELLQKAAGALVSAGFDVEIVEKHHNRKLDAPSGTALALADAVNGALDAQYAYCFDRSGERRERRKNEIGISSVRGGTIVGEHEVIFAGKDEVIEIRHMAYSRAVFGKGAVEAAKFLNGKGAGLYDMQEVIGS